MSDEDGAAIDPRYDPAFQRGFSGEVQTGAHGQSTLRRTAAVNPAPPRPGPQRSEEFRISAPPSTHPVDAELAAPSPRSSSADSSSGEAFGRTAEGAAPPLAAPSGVVVGPRELARNPFVVALAVLAAVLILSGAIWAAEGFATIVANGGTRNEVEFWAAQTMSFGAPLAIVAGLAVLAVLLVLFGRSWRRSE
jgi:hypothetical protein